MGIISENPVEKTDSCLVNPLSFVDWVITILLVNIPVAGLIFLAVWGFLPGINTNKRVFCRAYLIVRLVLLMLMAGIALALYNVMRDIFNNRSYF